MSSKSLRLPLIVILVVFGIFTVSKLTQQTKEPAPVGPSSPSESVQVVESPTQQEVKIGPSGFSILDFNIKAGGRVIFINNDTVDHEIASNPHPAHDLFPILNVGRLKPGEKKEIQLKDPGIYPFHDHLNPKFTASFNIKP